MTTSNSFTQFIDGFTHLVDRAADEAELLSKGIPLLRELVSIDNWLPSAFALPHPKYYQQYLLHADPQDRFSVVSFVWGPGQNTPIHDHTVWAMIGMLRGSERAEYFEPSATGEPMRLLDVGELHPGMVESLSPSSRDIHRVSNAHQDRVSISVHVYGGNIGKISRHIFDPETGVSKSFISGYANQ